MKAPRLWKAALLCVGLVAFVGSGIGLFWYGCHVAEARNRVENWYAEVDNSNAEDKLRAIRRALLFYHHDHGAFPPTKYQLKPDGPVHSWRVLLVPYTDGDEGHSNYDFSQEWNSPDNLQALSKGWGAVFYRMKGGISWSKGEDDTATIIAIGEGDEWPSEKPLRALMVTKDKDRFLLVEYPDSEIHWMEPKY